MSKKSFADSYKDYLALVIKLDGSLMELRGNRKLMNSDEFRHKHRELLLTFVRGSRNMSEDALNEAERLKNND